MERESANDSVTGWFRLVRPRFAGRTEMRCWAGALSAPDVSAGDVGCAKSGRGGGGGGHAGVRGRSHTRTITARHARAVVLVRRLLGAASAGPLPARELRPRRVAPVAAAAQFRADHVVCNLRQQRGGAAAASARNSSRSGHQWMLPKQSWAADCHAPPAALAGAGELVCGPRLTSCCSLISSRSVGVRLPLPVLSSVYSSVARASSSSGMGVDMGMACRGASGWAVGAAGTGRSVRPAAGRRARRTARGGGGGGECGPGGAAVGRCRRRSGPIVCDPTAVCMHASCRRWLGKSRRQGAHLQVGRRKAADGRLGCLPKGEGLLLERRSNHGWGRAEGLGLARDTRGAGGLVGALCRVRRTK